MGVVFFVGVVIVAMILIGLFLIGAVFLIVGIVQKRKPRNTGKNRPPSVSLPARSVCSCRSL